jgi:hypothetical protein
VIGLLFSFKQPGKHAVNTTLVLAGKALVWVYFDILTFALAVERARSAPTSQDLGEYIQRQEEYLAAHRKD